MKVSIDFDGTLTKKSVQDYVKSLLNKHIEVFITTSRYENGTDPKFKQNGLWVEIDNKDLFIISDKLDIKRENIIFCNFVDKYEIIKDKNFIWHLDDDWIELNMLNKYTNIKGISVFGNNTWKNKCNKLLNI